MSDIISAHGEGRSETAGSTATDRRVPTCAAARDLITSLLQRCAADTSATRGDAHLAVTELISNAIRHGGGLTGFSADLSPDSSQLRLAVEDADSRLPRSPSETDRFQPGGRGWALVRRLADTCSVTRLPGAGKRITVTFAL
ncbi:ATP-binding protein [Streptomyces rubiginosohelvolus]|uniref:ATP-binding protein n=1 Tax=Streptomyces rubiginosohelvolus TaxID=67362 RepID=UPI0036DC6175